MKTRSGDYRIRWTAPDGRQLSKEVWRRLVARVSLHDLKVGEHEGRIDLRGISVPEVTKEELPPFRNWDLYRLRGQLEFRNVSFEDMDFSESTLKYLRFFNSRIINCRFDNADCKNWAVRASDVERTTFIKSSLRNAGLGIWSEGRGDIYKFVDFSHADMRGLISTSATHIDCDFSHARLDKVDFQSSSFIRCRFAGEVREVIFYDLAFKSKKQDPNPMEDVDFSAAQLRWVEFRRLNLDRVRFPEDPDHLVVRNYRCVLERALDAAGRVQTVGSRGVIVILKHRLKWIGPQQMVGVFNRLDFREGGGIEEERLAVDLLRRAEQECSRVQ